MTDFRERLLDLLAQRVQALPAGAGHRVAVDGVDGAGKSHLADELAAALQRADVEVVRASVDGFHHPPAVRYRQGRGSPDGFFEDSYDLDAFRQELLAPFAPGGSRRFVRAIHDVTTEQPVPRRVEAAPLGAVLVVDGILLHRPELRDHWDLSIYLDVPFEVSIPRGAQRGIGHPDPEAAVNRRYVEGQRRYLRECEPWRHATLVIDNTDLDHPVLGGRKRAE